MKLTDATIAVAIALALAWPEAKAAEFPDGMATPAADQVNEAVKGKTFEATLADGQTWRVQYNSFGYAFFNNSRGYKDDGEWTAEVGKVCMKWKKLGLSFNEVRLTPEGVLLRRDNGEIVKMVVK